MRTEEGAIQRFGGRCPYTDKPCKDWECDKCPVEEEERKWSEQLTKEMLEEIRND